MPDLGEAAWTVKRGGIVAYPTESFYALGADASNARTVRKLFHAKRRQAGKPIALVAADLRQVRKFFYLSSVELKLAKKCWPGAVTILLRPKRALAVRALLGTTPPLDYRSGHPSLGKEGRLLSPRRTLIGVRVPAHAGARRLAKLAGVPLTATSANVSGQPPTKSARKVKRDFPGILVMSGRCGRQRRPSTIVERHGQRLIVHRAGALTIVP